MHILLRACAVNYFLRFSVALPSPSPNRKVSNSRMVTNCGKNLIVWNVASGNKIRCLPCKPLFSFFFTVSGNFLGTVDIKNVFRVYDVSNNYSISKCQKLNSQFPVEIGYFPCSNKFRGFALLKKM